MRYIRSPFFLIKKGDQSFLTQSTPRNSQTPTSIANTPDSPISFCSLDNLEKISSSNSLQADFVLIEQSKSNESVNN